MSVVPVQQSVDLSRLRAQLEQAERDRVRVNRTIRRLRDAIQAVENGEPLSDFAEILGMPLAPPPPLPPPVVQLAPGSPAFTPPGNDLETRLGAGLPPGQLSPVPLPVGGAAIDLSSVDVGLVARMTPEQLDALPFGVVTVDTRGKVVGYNDTESRMVGLPRTAVVGRNFFSEVAPCARVRDFEGRFRNFSEGRSRLALETFEFVFHFSKGAQRVLILISPARLRGQFHISMIRR
jgi:photoactive yellow protein